MIVSYETLRTLSVHLANCSIGLLLCDEGHRLKNSGTACFLIIDARIHICTIESLTFQALNGLNVRRRVILSGTPIQVWSLDTISSITLLIILFHRMTCRSTFHCSTSPTPISSARRMTSGRTLRMLSFGDVMPMPAMQTRQKVRRNSRSLVVSSRNSLFEEPMTFFRNIVCHFRSALTFYSRTFHVVPVKYEQVVFCQLSDFQLSLYRLFIKSPEIQALLRGTDSQPLKAINILKKLCNHPELLDLPNDLRGSDNLIPEGFNGAGANARERGRSPDVHCQWSGKFLVLER